MNTAAHLRRSSDLCRPDEGRCEFAEYAAKRAVREVFAILGVDVDEPKEVEDFRKDLRFGQSMRRLANHGALVLFGALVMAAGAAFLAGVRVKMGP